MAKFLCGMAILAHMINLLPLILPTTLAFHSSFNSQRQWIQNIPISKRHQQPYSQSPIFLSNNNNNNNNDEENENNPDPDDLSNISTSRFPTSYDDQIRQATTSIQKATSSGITRHSIRILLPLIGATELDDWPGGARQQMEAASPLVSTILSQLASSSKRPEIRESVIDESDGVRALFSITDDPKQDACAILLPSADTVSKVMELDEQVGPSRNLILVNVEWRRQSDFSFLGRKDKVRYVEKTFHPTFACRNIMVEGDQVRIIRSFPGEWRVFLLLPKENEWVQIGTKDVLNNKNEEWETNSKGEVFDYGKPTYREIEEMIRSQEGYVPKSVTERASAAFTFLKDSL